MAHKHDIFKKAYPEHIVGTTESHVTWRDGTKMPVNVTESGKLIPFDKLGQRSHQEKLNDPTLLDQLCMVYYPGCEGLMRAKTVVDYDPGRIRYIPFFKKMYGTSKEEIEGNLVTVKWLPHVLKNFDDTPIKLKVTKINNVADKVESISAKLEDELTDEQIIEYLDNPGGTFCYRKIAGTDRLSAHSFGMTLDINALKSNYWLWDLKKEHNLVGDVREEDIGVHLFPAHRNTVPGIIVQIFHEEGFIWGGHWYHFDTMHFEHRLELRPDLMGETEGL